MKPRNLVLMIAIALGLSLVVMVALPQQQQDQPKTAQQLDPDLESAHAPLYTTQDKAGQASRLTEAVASVVPGASTASVPRKNFVDEFIFGKMEQDKIPHAPLAGDEEFLRRAYLDATGLLPNVDEARAFISDKDANKRDKLIDRLIGSDAFGDQWSYHYDEWYRTQDSAFHIVTKEWLTGDRPYSEWFYDIVTPVARKAGTVPAARSIYNSIAYLSNRCTIWTDVDSTKGFNRLDWVDELTSDIGRNFLGISMDCFSCHNGAGHTDSFNLFLTSMKRSDFAQQAAFLGNIRLIGSSSAGAGSSFYNGDAVFDELSPGYVTADDGPYWTAAENRYPRDGKTYQPAFLLTGEKPKPGENPRKALGRILPNHIQFSRAAVNLIWGQLMVIGLVEPYDGFDLLRLDPKNPPPAPWTLQPANPELLQALAEDFRDHNFSVQRTIKTIMKSSAYQLSTRFEGQWKDAYVPYYARRFARVLSGPEAADIIAQATGSPYPLTEYGENLTYVKELTNPNGLRGGNTPEAKDIFAFMLAFYQAERAMPPVNKDLASPVQAMSMMSSPMVARRVSADGKNRVAALLKSDKSQDEMIEDLYLASLSRKPTSGETEVAKRLMATDRKKGTENLQWALLNSTEFLVNH